MNDHIAEEYRALNYIPGALIEIDLTSQLITYLSGIAFSIFGYSQHDIDSGMHGKEIFATNEELQRALQILESMARDNFEQQTPYTPVNEQQLFDFMLKKKGGDPFFGECQGAFVLDENKIPTSFRLYIRDLTQQRLVETSLHQSEEKYRTLVENSSDLIFLVDVEGNVVSANAAVAAALGKSVEELTGMKLGEMLPPSVAQTGKDLRHEVLSSGTRSIQEIEVPLGDRKAWFSVSMNPVRDKSDQIVSVLIVARSITKQKLAEHQLEKALKEAQDASSAKDQFIANISHEFRTPITSIMGYADYLKKNLEKTLTDKDLRSFESIHSNSDRLLRTVNAILSFSKMESGSTQMAPRYIYLNSFLKNLCDELRLAAHKKGLELSCTSTAEDDKMWLDEYSFREAMLQILQNAIKYTDDGRVSLKLRRNRNTLVLEISDTGIGIAVEYYKQMFAPFNQESEGLAREYQGLGLGLALAKRYLDWNKVKIEVSSKKGHGSVFTLSFPAEEDRLS